MYIDTATSILPLVPTLPQTSTSAGYSATVSRISSNIVRAESLVNSKVASRYDVSGFSAGSAPPILKSITEDITSFYTLRSVYTGDNQNVSEWVENFAEAEKLLDEIRDGKRDVLDASGNILGSSSTTLLVESNTEDYTPTFDEQNPVNWSVDENK